MPTEGANRRRQPSLRRICEFITLKEPPVQAAAQLFKSHFISKQCIFKTSGRKSAMTGFRFGITMIFNSSFPTPSGRVEIVLGNIRDDHFGVGCVREQLVNRHCVLDVEALAFHQQRRQPYRPNPKSRGCFGSYEF